MALREHGADSLYGLQMKLGWGRLEDDGIRVTLLAKLPHVLEGNEDVFVIRTVVGGVLNFIAKNANDGEGLAFDLYDFADGRISVKEFFCRMRSEDDDLAMLGEVSRLEEASLLDVESAGASIGKIYGLGLNID